MNRITASAHLRDTLAELYPEAESARRVAADAGLATRQIAFSNRAVDNWHAILQAALHQGKSAAICQVALAEYPTNPALTSACQAFQATAAQSVLPVALAPTTRRAWRFGLLGLLMVVMIAGFVVWQQFQTGSPSVQDISATSAAAAPTLQPPVPTAQMPITSTHAATQTVANSTAARRCPADRLCILIARFAPETNETANQFTDKLVQEIRTVLDTAATAQFVVQTVPPVTDPEQARTLARAEGALLIVWGQVFTALEEELRVSVNFQISDLLGVGEAQSTRPYRVQPLFYDAIAGYCADCVYLEASQRTTVVAYAVAGLVYYAQQQPRQARQAFLAALYCAGGLDEPTASEIKRMAQPACTPPLTPLPWDPGLLYYYTGKAFYLEGDYRSAQSYLEQATARNPADPAAWIALATVWQGWLAQPDAPAAQAALRTAVEKATHLLGQVTAKDAPVVYFNRGFARELAGDARGAQEDYQAAVDGLTATDANPYVAQIALARAQRLANERATAQTTLTRTLALAPDLPWAYLELAQLERDNRAEWEKWLEQAVDHAPSEFAVALVRARLCKQAGDYSCAADAYAQARKLRPESGLLYLEVGDFYLPADPALPQQNLAQAITYYKTAVQELRPNDPSAHQRLAIALSQQQAYAEAIAHYQRVIELVYSEFEAAIYHCDIGRLQQVSSLQTEAKVSFQRCADLTTDDALRQQAAQWLKEVSN